MGVIILKVNIIRRFVFPSIDIHHYTNIPSLDKGNLNYVMIV